MRSRIFRVLAGLLAVAFAWLPLVAEDGQLPLRRAFWIGAMAVVFGLFALFGPGPAERLLGSLFGVGSPPKQSGPPGNNDDGRASSTVWFVTSSSLESWIACFDDGEPNGPGQRRGSA